MQDAAHYARQQRAINEGKTLEEKEDQLCESFGSPVRRMDRMLNITEEGIDQLRQSIECSERVKATQRLDAVQQQMTQFHSLLDKVEELKASKEELEKSLIASRLELADLKSQSDHQKFALMRCEMDLKMSKAENARLRRDNARHENVSRQRQSLARGERLTQSLRYGARPNLVTALLDRSFRSESEEDTRGNRRLSRSMTVFERGRHEGFRTPIEENILGLLDVDDGGVDWGDSSSATRGHPNELWNLSAESRELAARDFAK